MRFGPDIESIVSKQLNAGSVVSNWSVEMSHFGKWIAGLVAAAGLAGLVAPAPAMAQAVNPGDSAGYPPAPYADPAGRTNDLSSIYAAANYPPPQRMPGAPPPPQMQPAPPPLATQPSYSAPVNPQQAYANPAPVYRQAAYTNPAPAYPQQTYANPGPIYRQPVYQPSAYPATRPIMAAQAPPTRTNGYATPSFGSAPSLAAPSYSAQPAPAYAGQAAPRQVMAQGWTAPSPSYPLPRQTYAQPAYAQPGYGQGYAPAAAGPNLSQVYRYAQPSPYMQVAYAQPVAQPTYLPAPAYAAQPGCGCGPTYVAAPPVRVAASYDVGGSRVSRRAMTAAVAPQPNHNSSATHAGRSSVHHAHKPRAQAAKGQDCGCGAA